MRRLRFMSQPSAQGPSPHVLRHPLFSRGVFPSRFVRSGSHGRHLPPCLKWLSPVASPRVSPCRTSCRSWAGPSRSTSCGLCLTPASALCAPTTGTQVTLAVRFLVQSWGPCPRHEPGAPWGPLLWSQARPPASCRTPPRGSVPSSHEPARRQEGGSEGPCVLSSRAICLEPLGRGGG